MLRRVAISFSKSDVGAAAVEFAILLPLMLLLVVGFIEFGELLYQQQELEKSVRDATRYLSYYSDFTQSPGTISCSSGTDPTDVKTAADNLILYASLCAGSSPIVHGLTTSDITISTATDTVTAPSGSTDGGSCSMDIPTVTVMVQTPYSDVFGFLSYLGMSNIGLVAKYTMRELPDVQGSLETCTSS